MGTGAFWECSEEHLTAWRDMDEDSHINKHLQESHPEMDEEAGGDGFIMMIHKQCKSAYQRQISEATIILSKRSEGVKLLNAKQEYDRCLLPELTTELGKKKQSHHPETSGYKKRPTVYIQSDKPRKKRRIEKAPNGQNTEDMVKVGEKRKRTKTEDTPQKRNKEDKKDKTDSQISTSRNTAENSQEGNVHSIPGAAKTDIRKDTKSQ